MAATRELPEQDYDRVAREAAQVTPGAEYVESLPQRRAGCTATSSPFSHSPIVARMVEGMTIRLVCLEAMLLKLGKLYYHRQALGPDGLKPRFEQALRDPYR